MSTSRPISREKAVPVVEGLLELLTPACHRIEPAGSYRRQVPIIHDLEIVCIPGLRQWEDPAKLFDEWEPVSGVWLELERLKQQGRLRPLKPGSMEADARWHEKRGMERGMGARLYRVELTGPGLVVEFWTTTPERWGCIYTIRTGSVPFSIGLVTHAKRRGFAFKEGRLWRPGVHEPFDTPEEIDVFNHLNIPYVNPEDRKEFPL